jgi:anti-sigma B factor antagonist
MPAKHLEASVRPTQGDAILELRGEINGFAQEALNAAYTEAEKQDPGAILLNFEGLEYMNSSGIGLLVTLLIRINREKQKLLTYGLSEHYRNIFQITRLDDAIGIYDSEEEAVRAADAM